MDPNRTAFDARQLKRWSIDERRLPPGSAVLFRELNLWTQYRAAVIATVTIVAGQTVVVSLLLIQGVRRRRAEVALRESERRFRVTVERNQDLAGRLIHAQEAERSRIARELHDDLSQQLDHPLSALKRDVGRPGSESENVQTVTLQNRTSTLAKRSETSRTELHQAPSTRAWFRRCASSQTWNGSTISRSRSARKATSIPYALMSPCACFEWREALANAASRPAAHHPRQLTGTDHSLS
jgi:hypothetical protein